MSKTNATIVVSLLLLAAVCISFFSWSASGQSTTVTTTTTISQPAAGQCSEISIAFSGQMGNEIYGVFGSDASVSFYVLSPADLVNIQNPTCSLPPSSRPLYSETNVVGYDNNYRSLPFPETGTYYFVIVLMNSGPSQLVNGYATVQLTYPASTIFIASTQQTSSSSISLLPQSTTQPPTESSTATAMSTGSSFTTLGVVGLVVVIGLIGAFMVFMKRGKGAGAEQKAVLKEEVEKETKPEIQPQPKPEIKPKPKIETKPQISQPKPTQAPASISTGYSELDSVLAGGLPLGYAILIVSPPCDERDLLFRKIIESSLSMGSPVFFLSRDLIRTQDFVNRYGKNFHIFSPQADKIVSAGGGVYKVQGLQNLSDLNISFTQAVGSLPDTRGKLIIIDLLSDILLEHKALTTRKWLDGFISKRKTEGFTIIGALNPLISTAQDTQTIMDLFDGIIEIYERELKERARRFLIVKKMYGRNYTDTELMLDKDKLYSP